MNILLNVLTYLLTYLLTYIGPEMDSVYVLLSLQLLFDLYTFEISDPTEK